MTSASDVFFTYCCGLTTTMTSAPLIHPFNAVAAAAAKEQVTSTTAAKLVYQGMGVHDGRSSLLNMERGLAGHVGKELVRSVGRIIGVVFLEKSYRERFGQHGSFALAGTMALYEIVFANPADVLKSRRSVGMPFDFKSHADRHALFQGSLGNFVRQFLMWFVWSKSTPSINKFLDTTFEGKSGDKKKPFSQTHSGIVARSAGQALACTICTYPAELVLRTTQVRCADYPVKTFGASCRFIAKALTNPSLIPTGSAYWLVTSDLIKKNGLRGLTLGFSAKAVGNTILLINANFMGVFTGYMSAKVGRT